jgi:hypothetical protein
LSIGLLIYQGLLMLVPVAGMFFLAIRRDDLAAGVFIAAAIVNLGLGASEPFLFLWRLRPVLAMFLYVVSSVLLLVSALVLLARGDREHGSVPRPDSLPPPPKSVDSIP